MKVSQAFDGFESALKSMRAAEIAALGAQGSDGRDAASELATALDNVRAAAVRLWSLPATGPSDLVLKARALRWHFPDGVEIANGVTLGTASGLEQDASLGAIAIHYIFRDLLALSE